MRPKGQLKPPKLSLVNPAGPAVNPLQPPVVPPARPLGPAGTQLWEAVQRAYSVEDAGGAEILSQACAALDRAEELAGAIARDGAIVQTRNGPREHPGLRAELSNRAFVVRSLARLGLDVEPVRAMGRPPGVF